MNLLYATGNAGKFRTAGELLSPYGVILEQQKIPVVEIQSESIEEISRRKAIETFEVVKKPLIVNDTGWYIEALNGFPGPFMAYMNTWFTSRHFIDLMQHEENRKVVMKQVVTYIDAEQIKVFEYDSPGVVLGEVRGSVHNVWDPLCSLSESGLSIAEEKDRGNYRFEFEQKLWEMVGEWLHNKRSA